MEGTQHELFMREALKEAEKARELDEVPIGAVVVRDGEIIGRGHNLRESTRNATMHAEMVAIQEANEQLVNWRLEECDLYVTVEPCVMCGGAIIWSRMRTVYFGAHDPKGGAAGSLLNVLEDDRFNHTATVYSELLAEESQRLLKDFFRELRKRKKKKNGEAV
ncbi:tRNA-specific adenosine deaminase [Dolosigranulum pigrum]|uniref:tRNA adenosine(34) deaminase TadA n=1 Tax=Dolosigranulum pigrum TaxID=29394 RepID=UPI000DC02151|nr:tRNA adenosine(34) deaminase TadA [Dolosigranulum pigrum]RAN53374.1 tRNA-specific adenosine deaminase [Dolosigranulum pigrum]